MRETLSQVRTWARSPSADIVLATALAAYAMLEIWQPGLRRRRGRRRQSHPRHDDAGGDSAACAPQARTAAVLAVVVAALTAQALLTVFLEGLAGIAALLVAVYSVAAHAEATRALAGLAVALAGAAAIGESASDGAFNAFLVGGTWIAGRALRTARVRTSELEALAAQLEQEREERARLAVAEERARIARELHDVVAHGVSTMVVQAEAGEALLDSTPNGARESLTAIQSTGREALGEMRRLLGLLRRGDVGLALAPQPGLAELGRLAEQVTQRGCPSSSRWPASHARCRPGSTSPPIGSCRRPSRTPSPTPGLRAPASRFAMASGRSNWRSPMTATATRASPGATVSPACASGSARRRRAVERAWCSRRIRGAARPPLEA